MTPPLRQWHKKYQIKNMIDFNPSITGDHWIDTFVFLTTLHSPCILSEDGDHWILDEILNLFSLHYPVQYTWHQDTDWILSALNHAF